MAKTKSFFLSRKQVLGKETKKSKSAKKEYNCDSCGLGSNCSGQLRMRGRGNMGILIVSGAPNRVEDSRQIPLIGPAGDFLRNRLELFGINLERDCWVTNALKCYPGSSGKKDKEPTNDQLMSCLPKLMEEIEKVKPKLIITLGKEALKLLIKPEGFSDQSFVLSSVHGLTFPIHRVGCWVGASFHPGQFTYTQEENLNHNAVFENDLAEILRKLGEPLPKMLSNEMGEESGNEAITNAEEAIGFIESLNHYEAPVAFDFETNSIEPYISNPKVISISFSCNKESAVCIPFDYVNPVTKKQMFTETEKTRIAAAFHGWVKNPATKKVVQNLNMENSWCQEYFGAEIQGFHHDTMIAAHVLNCRDNTTGLKFMAFQLAGQIYGLPKEKLGAMENVILEELVPYNCLDTRFTFWMYEHQREMLDVDPELDEFCQKYMEGAPVLSRMKHRGIRMDKEYLEHLKTKYILERDEQIRICNSLTAVKNYNKQNPQKPFSIKSTPQIGAVLYDHMKQTPFEGKGGTTKKGKAACNKDVFPMLLKTAVSEDVRTFISAVIRYRMVEGSNGILKRIQNFEENLDPNGYIHPTYTLNIAKTYRSSCVGCNVQNIPKHDKEQKLIRKAVVPDIGNLFLECDYSALEVRIIAMESGDKILIQQLVDKFDLHSKWSKRLYQKSIYGDWESLEPGLKKDLRYNGKNGFVFANFYGSFAKSIAQYEEFQKAKISPDWITKVYGEFWEEYAGVRKWQLEVVSQYNKMGYFTALPKFKRQGPLSLFQLYNNPTQGTGFQLVLDGAKKVDKEVMKRKLRSKLNLEVHDSVTFNAVPSEIPELIEITEGILPAKRYDWQGVPTPLEWEIGENWYDMETIGELDSIPTEKLCLFLELASGYQLGKYNDFAKEVKTLMRG